MSVVSTVFVFDQSCISQVIVGIIIIKVIVVLKQHRIVLIYKLSEIKLKMEYYVA